MEDFKRVFKIMIIVFPLFVFGWCVMVVFAYKNNNKKIAAHKQHTEEVYGNIQFKGKVLRLHRIDRWGRVYGMMCIKLDYTNRNDFYRFDDMSCLKIKNGIVTLPTGSISNNDGYDKRVNAILSASYIEVNMDNSREMVFIDSTGNKFVQDYLYYRSANLVETDLLICDDCR